MTDPDRIEVSWVVEAAFGLDGGAMFGIIPKPLWSRANPADEANRIDLGTRCLVIRHPTAGTIVVNVGIGDKWSEKSKKIYKMDVAKSEGQTGIVAALAKAGIAADEVNHVVLTHFHFDHAGGISKLDASGGISATFPNATHHALSQNWDWANAPSERDAGSFRQEDFGFFNDAGAPTLELYAGMSEIFEGVTLIPRHGHTPGMAIVKVDAFDDTWCFMADLIPTMGHLRIPYVMGYDLDPMTTCREKREILAEASRHGWKLVFEHDPTTAFCRVEPDGRGQYRPIPQSIEEDTTP